MKHDDVMIEIHLMLQRDGTFEMRKSFPRNEPIAAHKVLELGMLDVARDMILAEFRPGRATIGEQA